MPPTPTDRRLAELRQAFDRGELTDAWRGAVQLFRSAPTAEVGLFAIQAAQAVYVNRDAVQIALALVRQDPQDQAAWKALGRSCANIGEHDKAIEALRRAIRLGADVEALDWLGQELLGVGRHDEAELPLRQAIEREPDRMTALAALVSARRHRCLWVDDGAEQRFCEHLRAGRWSPGDVASSASLAQLLPVPEATLAQVNRDAARRYTGFAQIVASQHESDFSHPPDRRGGDPIIRVGYMSAGLRNFPTGHLTRTLYRHHDRSRVRIYAYQYGAVDDSIFSEAIRDGVDVYRHVQQQSPLELAQTIHGDGIDILVDLKGFSSEAKPTVAALRPAPIQVNWLGFPGTWGSAEIMDYVIVDRTVLTEADLSHYAEQPVWMPHCYQPTDDSFCPLTGTTTRADWDLPEDAVVFCAFNSLYKISPEFFAIWMEILKAVPNSVIWMLRQSAEQLRNLRRAARSHGVSPARIVFARRVDKLSHLARLAHADLALDNLPYGAHTTASDCLWAGLPILTVSADTFASRVCRSIVEATGFPELIARDVDQFRDRAVALATDPQELRSIRERLATERYRCPQFDTHRFARALDDAYCTMWQRYQRGEGPAPIDAAGAGAGDAWYAG
ncbi:MAG: glycosyltransferase [Pseudomonadota bacterium]